MSLTAGGLLAVGLNTSTTAATAGEVVIGNNLGYRAVNAAGNSTFNLIALNAADKVAIDGNAKGAVFGAGATFGASVKLANNTSITLRNVANTADLSVLGVSNDNLLLGRDPLGGATVSSIGIGAAGTQPMGFFGTGGTTRATITGSRSAATVTVLALLLSALNGYGLIVDSTTA
jgi:hypothetical protein